MKYKQLSIFDFGVKEPNKTTITVVVERPEGTTYNQVVAVEPGQTPKQAFQKFQKEVLGDPYAWYTTSEGEHKRYIKKNAYLAVTYWENK